LLACEEEHTLEFDNYTITLLVRRPDAPELTEQQAAELQDAHLSYLADLADAGHPLAAGPLRDGEYAGLSILNVDAERALELKHDDPAVRASVYGVRAIPWMLPAGLISFSKARMPRSVAEAMS
jgi:uncharacterized protein YciI